MTDEKKPPIAALIIGMAGSGKSTLMQRICAHLSQQKIKNYVLNLDPAVLNINYKPNIDIRESINYKNVMNKYELGPNGAIMTSLNLFATKFEEVLKILDSKKDLDFVFFDTPGQIEVFTWSASGSIITESIASTYPTVLIYVIDTPRTTNPSTFMSNMLYACSIFYKTKLPFLLVFNKVDVMSHDFAITWMNDFESFIDALEKEKPSYMNSLNRSMCLVLDEFYSNLSHIGVSAKSGIGMNDLFKVLEEKRKEYHQFYEPELIKRKQKIQKELQAFRERNEKAVKEKEEAEEGDEKVKQKSQVKFQEKDNSRESSVQTKIDDVDDEDEKEEYKKLMSWLKQSNSTKN